MWGGRLFQTRGAWTQYDRWPKPLSFHFAQKRGVCFCCFSLELERGVQDGLYTQRKDERYSGKIQLSSGFLRKEMANRADASDLKTYWTTNVVNTLRHGRGGVHVAPRLLTLLSKEMPQLPTPKWLSCDTPTLLRDQTTTASVLSLFSFSLLPQSIASHLSPNTINTLLDVVDRWMKLMNGEVECRQQICNDWEMMSDSG